jgi:hypothetical protein
MDSIFLAPHAFQARRAAVMQLLYFHGAWYYASILISSHVCPI